MTRAAAIRAHVAAHPHSRGRDVAKALDLPKAIVTNELARMTRQGLLTATGEQRARRYAIARPIKDGWRLPPGEGARRQRERDRAESAKQRAKRAASRDTVRALLTNIAKRQPEKPVSIPGQSVDEWLANGGQIQREPANWSQPTRYPQPGFRFA